MAGRLIQSILLAAKVDRNVYWHYMVLDIAVRQIARYQITQLQSKVNTICNRTKKVEPSLDALQYIKSIINTAIVVHNDIVI